MDDEKIIAPETPAEPAADGPEAAPREPEAAQRELEAAQAKAAEYLDGWQRARAEFANYKKRVEREQADMYANATSRVISRYLDVVDDFDRALRGKPTEGDGAEALAKWAEGVALIYRKFQNLLDAEGVTRIDADGKPFDPNLHEAVVHEDSETHPSGHVVEVLRHGYKLGDRVIRPALVKVAK